MEYSHNLLNKSNKILFNKSNKRQKYVTGQCRRDNPHRKRIKRKNQQKNYYCVLCKERLE